MNKSSQKQVLSERLLSIDDVARRIGVVTTTIRRHLTELKVSGLQEVRIGDGSRLVRFREESLNRMIRRAAEREQPLIRNNSVRSGANVNVPVNT